MRQRHVLNTDHWSYFRRLGRDTIGRVSSISLDKRTLVRCLKIALLDVYLPCQEAKTFLSDWLFQLELELGLSLNPSRDIKSFTILSFLRISPLRKGISPEIQSLISIRNSFFSLFCSYAGNPVLWVIQGKQPMSCSNLEADHWTRKHIVSLFCRGTGRRIVESLESSSSVPLLSVELAPLIFLLFWGQSQSFEACIQVPSADLSDRFDQRTLLPAVYPEMKCHHLPSSLFSSFPGSSQRTR